MIIKEPRNPRPTGDTRGPNFPSSVDPGFDNPMRDKGGDTAGAGDVAGRKPAQKPGWWNY